MSSAPEGVGGRRGGTASPRSVVVVGSGAAGLAAAVAAAQRGATVTLLERSRYLGGTTALSGGVAWLPANAWSEAPDSVDDALTYLRGISLGDVQPDLVEVFVRDSRRVADRIVETTDVRWWALDYPDYHADRPGARHGGRSLEPHPIEAPQEFSARLVPPKSWRLPVTQHEVLTGRLGRAEIERRQRDGTLTMGRALVGGLLRGAERAGVHVRSGVRARRLLRDGDTVVGVDTDDGPFFGRVVLACGGFERDEALVRAFLRAPTPGVTGAPGNTGDGLRMALSVGAALGNMSEAWWAPTMRVPGDELEGAPLYRLILNERAWPGSILVDSRGRRFVDEAQNYNDLGRALHSFDPVTFSFPRERSWLVFDAAYRRRYHLGHLLRDDPDPEWLPRADDLAGLAARIGVPADALVATVERFNELADRGEDVDFGRGAGTYDRYIGDARAPHPTLGALRTPPFYAVRVHPGTLGTKGGPRTDADGRVLHVDGGVVPGLYAAGNAAANPFGYAYPGAGGTIGPALVFGTRAGDAAACD